MSETPHSPHPKHISESLPRAVGASPDDERIHSTKERDLGREVEGLTEELAEFDKHMQETSDPALPKHMDDLTQSALDAQRDLHNHQTDGNTISG